jgi:apolipoprotein N-acyltransferase
MKRNNLLKSVAAFFNDKYFYQPAIAALLLGLSRYPIKLNFAVFFAFIPLLVLFDQEKIISWSKVIKIGLTYSTVYTLVALYWISVVTFPGFIGLFILFGIYYIILFKVLSRLYYHIPYIKYLSFALVFLSFEYLQNFGQLRFPWFNIGYSIAEYTSLIQPAELGGVFLLSGLILTINILIHYFIRCFPLRKSIISGLAVLIFFCSWFIWGRQRMRSLPLEMTNFKGAIVQVSIPQYLKWDESFYQETLNLYREYSIKAAKSEPDLIIFPEAAIPDYILKNKNAYVYLQELTNEVKIPIFLGFPHYEIEAHKDNYHYKYYNAATVIDTTGTAMLPYYKRILVPFGERIPFMESIPFLGKLDFGQANWEYGKDNVYFTVSDKERDYKYSSIICFEIAFPKLITEIAQQQPDFIVNVTNDAWFKKTVGPYQHAMMAIVRAVENRTQIYRSANTGISMVIDPIGNITQKTKLFERTVIEGELAIYRDKSIYVKISHRLIKYTIILTAILFFWTILTAFSIRR